MHKQNAPVEEKAREKVAQLIQVKPRNCKWMSEWVSESVVTRCNEKAVLAESSKQTCKVPGLTFNGQKCM